MISKVLMETLVVRDLEAAAAAWREELGWEVRSEGAVDEALAGLWGVSALDHPRFALFASPGSSRGFIRLVQGPEDDGSSSFERLGLFNAELLCADGEALLERLRGSRAFVPLSGLNTYDLGATGGAISRSFATRGPGGAGVFFTQYLKVPPPRTLPRCDHLVGPMFNSALAVENGPAMASFYEGVLGMGRRFEMRIAQPSVNRILGFPEDWAFHMVVYKGEGDGLVEVDLHDRSLPGRAPPAGRLLPGNASLTLETRDLEGAMRRAREKGWVRAEGHRLGVAPYEGRRVARVEGPSGESIELVEAPA